MKNYYTTFINGIYNIHLKNENNKLEIKTFSNQNDFQNQLKNFIKDGYEELPFMNKSLNRIPFI